MRVVIVSPVMLGDGGGDFDAVVMVMMEVVMVFYMYSW